LFHCAHLCKNSVKEQTEDRKKLFLDTSLFHELSHAATGLSRTALGSDSWLQGPLLRRTRHFFPRGARNQLLPLPTKGRPIWVGLDKYRNGRPAKGRRQSQY